MYALAFSMNGAAEADGVEGMGWVTATYRFDGADCGKNVCKRRAHYIGRGAEQNRERT